MTTVTTPPTPAPYRSAVPAGRDGFGQLVRAEWTKLWSVRRWVLGLLATIPLTLMLSLLTAAGSSTNINDDPSALGPVGPDGEPVTDDFHFVHQPLAGDGSVTARIATLEGGHEEAQAGLMLKQSSTPGSPYAAVVVTPSAGVRFHANYTREAAGGGGPAPRWLRLARSATTVTGYESADGERWHEVGTVELAGLPETVLVGLLVASPNQVVVESSPGGASVGEVSTQSTASFDRVEVAAVAAQLPGRWRSLDTSAASGEGIYSEAGGVFTVTGSGEIGPNPPDDDVTQLSLLGVNVGLIAVAAVGVLLITAEYRRGMIRTTFAASPRRGRVLIAKAIVLAAATLVVGLAASLAAFFLAQPTLRANGFGPPAIPVPSLADPAVLRAVLGAAGFLSLVAVFSLGLGAILRRSVGAITAVVVLFVLLPLLVGGLPPAAAQWVMRTTPAAGLAILQTVERDYAAAVEPWSMAPPWAGLGVLAGYAVVALAAAVWLVRRRDA